MPSSFAVRASGLSLNLLRIATGFCHAQHGAQKLLGAFGGFGESGGAAPFMSIFWIAGLIETIGGTLVALGLFTRPVAFLLSGEMAVAYFQFHAPKGFWPILNHGELPVLYSFIYLFLAANGGGNLSLDGLFRRKPTLPPPPAKPLAPAS
jgi:putative oxidoreductase